MTPDSAGLSPPYHDHPLVLSLLPASSNLMATVPPEAAAPIPSAHAAA
eukprot:CAMPEP_0183732852 /NCGR_PEP_ID=MMETSP0737-20130205/39530_1 /TAXON_ID=385413 /ORGANISM="Thalassiosira miniscula, Strain CCMP1093" /LENGTH=47 /DNA_ID= /DNA_START= /DNA_END= /DNA_ORIENTATION=